MNMRRMAPVHRREERLTRAAALQEGQIAGSSGYEPKDPSRPSDVCQLNQHSKIRVTSMDSDDSRLHYMLPEDHLKTINGYST